MRCVFDTDVLVAGLRSESGASRQLLIAAADGRLDLVVSVPLVLEWEAVLKRPVNLAAAGIGIADVDAAIDFLVMRALRAELHFLWRPQTMDPNDEVVLETAINGVAETIVSFDARHLRAAARHFGIGVLRPGELLRSPESF